MVGSICPRRRRRRGRRKRGGRFMQAYTSLFCMRVSRFYIQGSCLVVGDIRLYRFFWVVIIQSSFLSLIQWLLFFPSSLSACFFRFCFHCIPFFFLLSFLLVLLFRAFPFWSCIIAPFFSLHLLCNFLCIVFSYNSSLHSLYYFFHCTFFVISFVFFSLILIHCTHFIISKLVSSCSFPNLFHALPFEL